MQGLGEALKVQSGASLRAAPLARATRQAPLLGFR